MNLLNDLVGGVLVIIAAGAIGIAQNAVRDDSVALIPETGNAVAKSVRDAGSDAAAGARTVQGNPASSSAANPGPPVPTSEELSEGEVTQDRLAGLLDAGRIVLIDARSPEEYERGHIAGAVNIPYDQLIGYYDTLRDRVPMDAYVVCYCESYTCDTSDNLATELRLMGYRNVVVYKGGWEEWEQSGHPVE